MEDVSYEKTMCGFQKVVGTKINSYLQFHLSMNFLKYPYLSLRYLFNSQFMVGMFTFLLVLFDEYVLNYEEGQFLSCLLRLSIAFLR